MRHKLKRQRLNRFTSWYKATLNSLARALLINQSIRTTKKRALAVRPLIEKLINLAKENTLTAKRRAFKVLCDHKLVSQLFNDIGPRFKDRTGGYSRILNLGIRRGDSAQLAVLELTEMKKKEIKRQKKEIKKEEEKKPEHPEEKAPEAVKPKTETKTKEEKQHPANQKVQKKFLGGIRNIFKKQRDSL